MYRFLCTDCFGNDSLQVVQCIREGSRLMASSDYRRAGIFFEKAVFLGNSPEQKTLALLKKADCCLADSDFRAASDVLSRVPYEGLSDTLEVLARTRSALAAYLGKDFNSSESQLIQAINLLEDSSLTVHLMPLQALVYNEQRRWKEASQVLDRYIRRMRELKSEENIDIREKEILQQYSDELIPQLKNPEKAKMLSSVLPGMGYLYAGNVSEGIWNVALQAAGLGLTALGILNGYYFTSAFISISIFQKFYNGGISRSAFHAEKWNYEKSKVFNDAARIIILRLMKKKQAPN